MTDAAPGSAVAAPHRLRDLSRRDLVIAGAVFGSVAVAAAVLLWRLRTGDWTQVGDEANQINGAQRALSEHPLLGDLNTANLYGNPLSHHPGPIAWYLLAPWVLLLGPQLGGWLFALAWNLVNLALAGVLAYRSGGRRTALVALVALPLAVAHNPTGHLASSFFQYTPLLAIGTFLLACWAVARADPWPLVVVVFLGTFIVQSASIQAPLVGTVAITAMALGMRRRPGDARTERWGGPLIASVLLGAVLWLPPLIDQLARTGNLGKLLRIEVVHAGIGEGLGTLLERLGTLASSVELLVWIGTGLLLAVAARRMRPKGTPAEAGILAAIVVGSVATAAWLPANDVEQTHVYWISVTLAGAAIIATSVLLGDRPLPRAASIVGALTLIVAMVDVFALASEPVPESLRDRSAMAAVLALEPQIDRGVEPDLPIFTRGGWTAVRIGQGLSPLLHDRRPGTRLAGGTPTPGTIIVVATPPVARPGDAVIEAVHRPPPTGLVDPDLVQEVVDWAGHDGSLQLHPAAETVLPRVLDGRVPAACVDDLLADPNQLLELDPELAIALYAEGLVASPELPRDLAIQINPWLAEQPVAVYRVQITDPPRDEVSNGADPFLFTRSSC